MATQVGDACPLADIGPDGKCKEQKTDTERLVLTGAFLGLALWAWICPCKVIFKCHRASVLAVLGGVFLWIFFRTK